MDPLTVLKGKRRFLIHVKPNAKMTEILRYDEAGDLFTVAVKTPPIEGKANEEIERYFRKLLKKSIRIKSGLSSKIKLIELVEN
jgi:uncharacterized protein (TIGR00251 family)